LIGPAIAGHIGPGTISGVAWLGRIDLGTVFTFFTATALTATLAAAAA